jgi:DHA2 family multidrug resistance protein-like MFS transporter
MISALLPLSSLGESASYRTVYITGIVLFTLASLICGIADSLGLLIAGRVLQGVGGAAIMSVNTAFIRHLYPPEKLGKGLSLNALFVAIAFTLGPPITSAVLSLTTWHWLFLLNIPVGLFALLLSVVYLPDAKGLGMRFEKKAALLCAAGLGLLSFSLCFLEGGGNKLLVIVTAAACILCLCSLIRLQSAHPAPILATDLLKIPVIGLSSVTSICAFATQALAFVSLPFFLRSALGISVIDIGLLLTPWPIVVALMAVVVSPLSDRFSSGVLCSIGLMLLSVGMFSLAMLSPDSSHQTVALRLILCGAGFGLFQAPNLRAIMGNAPRQRSGGASGLVGLSRLLGQTTGAAMVAQSFHLWFEQGPRYALVIGGCFAVAGCIFSGLRLRWQ